MADDDEVESGSGDTYTASKGSRLCHCIKREREGLSATTH
jgi:hypothetical protein